MKIAERGIVNAGEPNTSRAVATLAAVSRVAEGRLLASYRVGSSKDSSDGTIELRWSTDGGRCWEAPQRPFRTVVEGVAGSLRVGYITALDGQHLLAAAMWIDRQAHPGRPLFNEETEGCLPMRILLADSRDGGQTWSTWRSVPFPEEVGPPSLTSPVLRLPSGRLVLSVETNKTYDDTAPWMQRVVYVFSDDNGQTWSEPITTCQDPRGRVFHWDQRAGLCPDGRLVTYTWTYDRETNRYLNIQRRTSSDEGVRWTDPVDLGFADQPSHPAVLRDGRIVLAWVDRFGTGSIRARLAESVADPFLPESEVVLYELGAEQDAGGNDTAEMLSEMGVWSYGLPFAETLGNDDVLVTYYAGDETSMSIHWARLEL